MSIGSYEFGIVNFTGGHRGARPQLSPWNRPCVQIRKATRLTLIATAAIGEHMYSKEQITEEEVLVENSNNLSQILTRRITENNSNNDHSFYCLSMIVDGGNNELKHPNTTIQQITYVKVSTSACVYEGFCCNPSLEKINYNKYRILGKLVIRHHSQ